MEGRRIEGMRWGWSLRWTEGGEVRRGGERGERGRWRAEKRTTECKEARRREAFEREVR